MRLRQPLYCWLQGGLGNQLFQLNAALTMSEHPNSLRLITDSFGRSSNRSFELGLLVPELQVARPWTRFLIRPYARDGTLRHACLGGSLPVISEVPDTTIDRGVVVGFFQDTRSASKSNEKILSRLASVPLSRRALELQTAVSGKLVVHVRRGDYVDLEASRRSFGRIEPDYYARGAQSLGLPLSQAVFFTNDADYVQSTFGAARDQIVDESDLPSPVENIAVMGAAEALILPNSTFSWWAAELVHRRGGRVAGPSVWFFDREDSSSLVRSYWNKLQIDA